MTDLRYPVGRFSAPQTITEQDLKSAIDTIAALPSEIRTATKGLTDSQLDTPYRPDGWTVRQVVHHVADSHMNSYVRCRLALTEDEPTIKPYDEAKWAMLPDARHEDIGVSLDLIESMHRRWTVLLRSLNDKDWARTFRHPERGLMRLDVNSLLYAWHSKHHVAHITGLRQRNGW